MDVSIIIVNYNTKALTKQCLESVFEKTQGIEFEVIVVDNASRDGSQQMLREEFPRVRLIESPENLGFGRANNLGAKYAKGDYLFLLNSDTILLNNAVKILADFLDEHQDVGVCGGNLFDEKQEPNNSYVRIFPSAWAIINDIFYGLPLRLFYGKNIFYNHSGKPIDVSFITGADMMIRKDIFDRLDGFDPDFFMYCEEMELQWRVSKVGYKRTSVPDACIIHLDGKSWSFNVERNRNWIKSFLLYFKKTQNKFSRLFLYCWYFVLILEHLIFFSVIGNKEKLSYWIMVFKALFNPPPPPVRHAASGYERRRDVARFSLPEKVRRAA